MIINLAYSLYRVEKETLIKYFLKGYKTFLKLYCLDLYAKKHYTYLY